MKIYKIILIALIFGTTAFAQSNSIYSRYGIGDLVYSSSARKFAMSDGGNTLFDTENLSYSNPASWSGLTMTRFETGIYFSGANQKSSTQNSLNAASQFSGFLLGFPLMQQRGISLVGGIVPFSRINYDVKNSENKFETPYTVEFKGEGGVSKAFLGASFKFPFDLNFGASFDYYVGNLNYSSKFDFENQTYTDAEFQKAEKLSGIGTTFGLITPDFAKILNFKTISNLRFSLSYNYIGELLADSSLLATTSLGEETLFSSETDVTVPSRLNLGAGITISGSHNFVFDYIFQPFSNYKFGDFTSANLKDLTRYSLGYEYKNRSVTNPSFWEQVALRGGLSYEQSQFGIRENNIDELGFYGGISFPLDNFNSIDFGIKYAQRGTLENNLVKENIVKMLISLSIGELWFIR